MGLDMYLRATKYIGGWSHGKDPEFDAITKLMDVMPCEQSPSVVYSVTVGYWRKANAIHKWFVDNVQDGEDNCAEYYVGRESLEELRDICKQITDAHANKPLVDAEALAADLLPPQEGFFFGGTEYDEWYFNDLQYTVNLINGLLDNPKLEGWDYQYQSSW